MVVCKLCGKGFKGSMASHLYWIHGISKEKYREKFPNAEIVSNEWRKNQKVAHSEQISWNTGLTKETSAKVRKYSESIKSYASNRTPEHNQHISDTKKKQFEDESFKDRMVSNLGENPIHWRKPNKPEIRMRALLDQFFPNQWKYVGDGEVVIGTMRPDFINVDGKKQIIEVYGDYWHRDNDPQDKINYYRNYGFETLIVWEHELYDDITPIIEKVQNLPINSHANAELNSSVNDDKCVETIYSASNKMDDDIVHP